MKVLILTAMALFLFVSGSLYMIKNSEQYYSDQTVDADVQQSIEKEQACGERVKSEENVPLIAEAAVGLGKGVSHGFDFILLLFYSFISTS
ncbi:hypothetical protein [Halobacillus sp. A5]|uniref:hypothetical protein n=1 Tax=Halobacillus sp. A5 TaxID=2880263 RepID=UPI0020A67BB4|nr:hypothetical protein [Halobacillus sp. A5]MCP3025623.1 hypothetical protein [Halobacillus sp. A5]